MRNQNLTQLHFHRVTQKLIWRENTILHLSFGMIKTENWSIGWWSWSVFLLKCNFIFWKRFQTLKVYDADININRKFPFGKRIRPKISINKF